MVRKRFEGSVFTQRCVFFHHTTPFLNTFRYFCRILWIRTYALRARSAKCANTFSWSPQIVEQKARSRSEALSGDPRFFRLTGDIAEFEWRQEVFIRLTNVPFVGLGRDEGWGLGFETSGLATTGENRMKLLTGRKPQQWSLFLLHLFSFYLYNIICIPDDAIDSSPRTVTVSII